MAGRRSHGQALFLALLMVTASWLSLLAPIQAPLERLDSGVTPSNVGEGATVDLTLTTTPNSNFKLDVPDGEPLVSAELRFTPKVLATQSGFVWDDAGDWNHADAISNGSSVSNGALTGSSPGTLWDFNNGPQGWTFSNSFSGRVTTPTCGINGSTGGSIRTYAGSTYATSPVVNLAGAANVPFHAWVRQGSSGCGEEPDSNENLYLQYKSNTGSWVSFRTFLGSTSGGTVTNVVYSLPSDALHASSQFRIHQNSGSSTCCDYWFVDDVHIATPPASNWTSPTLGYRAGSSQLLPSDTYAPLFLEASIPEGSFLNWSILNRFNETVPGMQGSNDLVIPVNALNHSAVDQFRVHLEFTGSSNGMPLVHSIAGDGSSRESFFTSPEGRGWNLSGAAWVPAQRWVTGGANDSMTSPWFLANAPLYDAQVTGVVSANAQVQIRHQPGEIWTNVTLPYTPVVSQDVVGLQVRVVAKPPLDGNMSNFTSWSMSSLHHEMFGGQHPATPGLDFNLDAFYEWGGGDERVGTWGWQDRFVNGQERVALTLTSGAPTVTKAWVPSDDLSSFAVSAVAQSGEVVDLSLFVQSTFIANRSMNGSSATIMQLNASEMADFTAALAAVGTTVDVMGTSFTEVRFEVTGQGTTVLAGLRATYNASQTLVADASSPFVMGVNQARTSVVPVGGIQAVPLPFVAAQRGGLTVEVLSLETSNAVRLVQGTMLNSSAVLTSGQRWQTISTEYEVLSGTLTHHRLDVFSQARQATWLFPVGGDSPVGLGDSALVELHPTSPFVTAQNGSTVTTDIMFRLRPLWDDDMQLTATSRLVMQNGVIAVPYAHTWGTSTEQGYENDLELTSVVFAENGVDMLPTRQYLRGGETMDLSVKVGFEGVVDSDGFVDGDAVLTLYQNGVQVQNTTHVDGRFWNTTIPIPFTYGDVTWTVQLQSLNGSTILEPAERSRTFTVDSVKPRVLSTSMEQYDHRTPSPTQVMQVTIMDQPVLPSNVDAMVWREWLDDTDLDAWPDADEYTSMPLIKPSDLTTLTGVYTLMLDDTGGSLGQKVAVYINGTDPSGYTIQNAGSGEEGDHLFMYQLAVDGAPTLDPDAFSWAGGRQPWLHPGQPYELDIKITEPNGGSDLSTVEVMLAGNQGSDTMSIEWTFETGNCTTSSTHIIIQDCTMMGANGIAGPYERDMVLTVRFHLGWNTPDLGENRREPSILVVDRSGQEETRSFPEHRWQFSAGLGIPEETVDLHLTRGSFLGDGARVTPLTPMEISGGVVFTETSTVPAFDCDVNVLFAGQTYTATAKNGIWSMALQAPASSGSLPMTWEIACIQGQGVDTTDQSTSVKWIVVDGTGPEPMEVQSPRPLAILDGENHEVRLILKELGGLDAASLELVWVVEDFTTGDIIRSGREPLTLTGEDLDGLNLELVGEMNLSSITQEMLINRMVAKISVEGRDLAGNPVTGLNGQLADPVIASWNMAWLQPKFELNPASMTYTRLLMEVGDLTSIQLEVENTGTLAGSIEVVFESVNVDGVRTLVHRTTVEADAGAVGLVGVDWSPTTPGMQWVEASLANGQKVSGPTVDVRVAEEPAFSEKVFGDVHPLLGTFTALLLLAVVMTLLIWMRRMTVNQGAKIAYDWDEYSADIEEEATFSAAAVVASETLASEGESEETDWVMGSDGYWWYHDKATNEWWYKDADGEIVKHP